MFKPQRLEVQIHTNKQQNICHRNCHLVNMPTPLLSSCDSFNNSCRFQCSDSRAQHSKPSVTRSVPSYFASLLVYCLNILLQLFHYHRLIISDSSSYHLLFAHPNPSHLGDPKCSSPYQLTSFKNLWSIYCLCFTFWYSITYDREFYLFRMCISCISF